MEHAEDLIKKKTGLSQRPKCFQSDVSRTEAQISRCPYLSPLSKNDMTADHCPAVDIQNWPFGIVACTVV